MRIYSFSFFFDFLLQILYSFQDAVNGNLLMLLHGTYDVSLKFNKEIKATFSYRIFSLNCIMILFLFIRRIRVIRGRRIFIFIFHTFMIILFLLLYSDFVLLCIFLFFFFEGYMFVCLLCLSSATFVHLLIILFYIFHDMIQTLLIAC